VAAAPAGTRCTARAVLREVADERKYRFDVEVLAGDRTIGVGTHERRAVPTGR
jgi:fluoroacetyl-CoA thioesterase